MKLAIELEPGASDHVVVVCGGASVVVTADDVYIGFEDGTSVQTQLSELRGMIQVAGADGSTVASIPPFDDWLPPGGGLRGHTILSRRTSDADDD